MWNVVESDDSYTEVNMTKISIKKNDRKAKFFNTILTMLLVVLGINAEAATFVKHNGITWNFSGDRQVGTFANGEYWVLGPVTISSIKRDNGITDANVNGSMVNPVPGGKQGFNSSTANYNNVAYSASLNAELSLPRTLQPGDTILSSEYGGWETVIGGLASLTVVSAPPAAGSFRPAFFGPGPHNVKYNKSQINTSILRSFASFSGAPDKATIDSLTPSGPWMEWSSAWNGNQIGPPTKMVAYGFGRNGVADSNYGREIAKKWATVALWLNLNHSASDKERPIIQLIQAGIDIAAFLEQGQNFYADGGHKMGRKLPVLMAGVMLNSSELKTIAANIRNFQEDQQVWYVTQEDVGRAVSQSGTSRQTYSQGDIGLAEWGIRHYFDPSQDDRRLPAEGGTQYRHTCADGMSGAWIAARLMGIQSQWNHPAAFAYAKRAESIFGVTPGFISEMNNRYSGGGVDVDTSLAGVTFSASPAQTINYVGDVISLSLAHSDSNVVIRFTRNNTEPTSSSEVYTSPLAISSQTTVKAKAFLSGKDPSATSQITLNFIDTDERPIDKSNWSIANVSSEGLYSSEKAQLAIDGNNNTFWHTQYATTFEGILYQTIAPDHFITIDMGECFDVAKIGYVPRQDMGNGRLQNYSFYLSNDLNSDGAAVSSGNFQGTSTEQVVTLPSVTKARYLKLVAGAGLNGNFASVAELYATGKRSAAQDCVGSVETKVAPVTLDPNGGIFQESVSVGLATATQGAQIRYTIDGSTPTLNSKLYAGNVLINQAGKTTLKAKAFLSGSIDSDVASASFEILAKEVATAPLSSPKNVRVKKKNR